MAKEPLIGSGGLALIRSAYPNLTPTEKRVADYCLQHPEETTFQSPSSAKDAAWANLQLSVFHRLLASPVTRPSS